jgi:hypothetical protein
MRATLAALAIAGALQERNPPHLIFCKQLGCGFSRRLQWPECEPKSKRQW